MNGSTDAAILGVAQLTTLVVAAPLLNGVIRKAKARFQMRRGPPLLQSYHDLAKWLARAEQVPDSVSFVHRLAPVLAMASVLAAILFLPIFAAQTPLTADGDLLVVVALLALGRAALALGGMDSGSAFGAMGSSREVAISALVEPVILMALAGLALGPASSRLGEIAAFGSSAGVSFVTAGWALAAAGFSVAIIAETGRIPVDNPDTHLELTMVHEGMLIEYSGRSLGMFHLAHMLKQIVFAVLLANLFFPWGLREAPGAGGYAVAAALLAGKLMAISVGLAVVESAFAKMRLLQLPDLIGAAAFGALLGLAVRVLE